MNEQEAKNLAKAIIQTLKEKYEIGKTSHFCDETDFDEASEEQLIADILPTVNDAFGFNENLKKLELPKGYKVELKEQEIRIYHEGHIDEQEVGENGLIFYAHQMFYRRPSMGSYGELSEEEKAVIIMVCKHIYNFEVCCLG